MDRTQEYAAQRPRLVRLAARVLGDPVEAEDVVQAAWLRLSGAGEVRDLDAWLTTVTTRLCLDRLRARVPVPVEEVPDVAADDDPLDEAVLAEDVGAALHVVLDRLTPGERVALVLHDGFGVDFPTVAAALDTTPVAARKLASRARTKVRPPSERLVADAAVVEAFLSAARGGDLARLLDLLAPGVLVTADPAAASLGSPLRLEGREAVASFFDGAARAARPVTLAGLPAAAWVHRGQVRVLFDITVEQGRVARLVFRADPAVLAEVRL